jgi:ATP-dependent DNA ligase
MASTTRRTGTARVEPISPPTWIKPQLAALVKAAPDRPDWLHEIKMDGYRMHARLDAGRVQILTRRGNVWTDKYPAIAEVVAGLLRRMPTSTASFAECSRTDGGRGQLRRVDA